MKAGQYDEMKEAISSAITEIREVGLQELRHAAEQKNVKLTEELFRSFKAELINEAGAAQQGIMLSFRLYGRLKDMKHVEYTGFRQVSNRGKKYSKGKPDLDEAPEIVKGMYGMITKLGLSHFKFLPGYTTNGSRRLPTTNIMMYRLAWALSLDRLRKGKIRNKNTKGWYNKAKATMTNKGTGIVARRISKMTVELVAESMNNAEIRI